MTIPFKTGNAAAPPAPPARPLEPRHDRSREWRFGFNSGGSRFYLDLRLGVERRTQARLTQEGRQRLPLGSIAGTLAGVGFFVAFGLICFLYLAKSLLGIDVFAGNSPLHALYLALVD